MNLQKYVIIVAGGKGLRMNANLPKQFIAIQGKPILMRTIEAFYRYDSSIHIIVVLPETDIQYWHELCEKYTFSVHHKITSGGETRFHSVQNGLNQIQELGLVAVHDGVRPFVSEETIDNCFQTAAQQGNAVPAIEPVDSIRKVEGNRNVAVNRADYRLIQTPQVFDVQKLKDAYGQAAHGNVAGFTDDASVFEFAGHIIKLVQGNRENIKITTSFDLLVAEAIMNK